MSAHTQVNAYAKVTAISGTTLSLSNVNTTYHSFSAGGQVIVMQMQDNVIGSNTSNTSTFGTLGSSGIANAGNYEVATISVVVPATGTPSSLTLTAALKKSYTIGANSSVQVISFRNLGTNYTTTSNITAVPWNGSIGGVVAIQLSGILTLKNSISADGLGFRGGAVSASYQNTCEPGVYISSSTNYAYKGEGIYVNTNSGYSTGRGKLLNGGGGGSDDNGGGGGGGNYMAGGDGGPGWTCTTAGTSSGGLGGVALTAVSSVNRIFMGGGGGGGQQNDVQATAGGNGGGIVLIRAASIVTSCSGSVAITANGISPISAGNDGAGGGGAGGTMVLQVAAITATAACPLTVQSNGGDGSDVNAAYSLGGGGGGSQGIVYSNVNLLTAVNVNASAKSGAGGLNSNLAGATSAGNGAGTANAGILAGSFAALPVTLISFSAALKDKEVLVSWAVSGQYQSRLFYVQRSDDGQTFTTIGTLTGTNTDMDIRNYSFSDKSMLSGKRFYRLEMADLTGNTDYSGVAVVNTGQVAGTLLIYPNPARQQFVIQVSGAGDKSYSLVITDLSGKPVYYNNYRSVNNLVGVTIDKQLSPGTYMIRLTGNNTTQYGKIMIL